MSPELGRSLGSFAKVLCITKATALGTCGFSSFRLGAMTVFMFLGMASASIFAESSAKGW